MTGISCPLSSRNVGPHRLGILGAELEDVADLDPLVLDHRFAAPRAGVAPDGVAEVEHLVERRSRGPGRPRSGERRPLVAADHHVGHRGDRAVDGQGDLDRPTGPRNPIGAPVAFSIAAGSAAHERHEAPKARRTLASLASWSPRIRPRRAGRRRGRPGAWPWLRLGRP